MQTQLSKEQLRSIIQRSWGWIDSQLDWFTPWRDSTLSLEGVQALAELSVLYSRLSYTPETWEKITGKPHRQAEWYQHLIQQLEHPAVAELPRKRPVQAFPYILPYVVMRAIGWRNEFYEHTIELLHSWGFPHAQEVIPFRELDVAYFFQEGGVPPSNSLSQLYERTFLARSKNAIHIDNDSAYSITHTIFYLSDFGRRKIAFSEAELHKAQYVLESLMIHYWRLGHWDLLGEVLYCLAIIGFPSTSLKDYAITAYFNAHYPDGFIAGRRSVESEVESAREENNLQGLFSGCYHTTIVSIFLATQLLHEHE